MFPYNHPRTLAHQLAIRVAKSQAKRGVIEQKMVIPLDYEVEGKFYSDDGCPGQDLVVTTDGEIVLILRVMKRRP